MTPLIHCKDLELSYSGKVLFDGFDFSISEGAKVGLIGSNGNGKSTLLKILSGEVEADEGEVSKRKHLKSHLVRQEANFDESLTILDCSLRDFGGLEGADVSTSVLAQSLLSRAGFENAYDTVGELSGGWKKRLQIVCGLLAEPELLLLDEPTNHMDLKAVLWLEGLLKQARFAWVVVSHDREFLNQVCGEIAEIDRVYKNGMIRHQGNYDSFIEHKETYLESLQSYSESLSNKVRREDEWLSRGPKARSTKAKGRIDKAHELKRELAQVKDRQKTKSSKIDFSGTQRKTKKFIEIEKAGFGYDSEELWSDLSLVVQPKSRLAILGKNGSGKSSLMKLLAKEHEQTSGKVKFADDLKIVYFDQQREALPEGVTLKRALAEESDSVVFQDRAVHVSSWARRFGFEVKQLETKVDDLSGGEKARVYIARLMLQEADILLLDEPTNDLDIQTREVLEESLRSFKGAVVLISHDRYMLKSVCRQFLGVSRSDMHVYAGFYQWFKNSYSASGKKPSGKSSSKKITEEQVREQNTDEPSKENKKKKKLSYMDQREFEQMEKKIMQAETKLEETQAKLTLPEVLSNSIKLQGLSKKMDEAKSEVERLYARWTQLENMQK